MLKGLSPLQTAEKIPYSDEEVQNNSFYRDFLAFLEYVEENNPKLISFRLPYEREIQKILLSIEKDRPQQPLPLRKREEI